MNRFEFFEKLRPMTPAQRQQIQWAYALAKEWHDKQKRDTGERYFEHVRGVANILIDHGYNEPHQMILAILHDSTEDTHIPISMLERLFGKEIAKEIITLSRTYGIEDTFTGFITHTEKKQKSNYYQGIARSTRRVVLTKCADRIHNLSSLPDPSIESRWTPEKRMRKVDETLKYIVPLADIHEQNFALKLLELCRKVEEDASRMKRHSA